jgi:nicotinate-nucleotide pyrophosphorylase (carboxylating)
MIRVCAPAVGAPRHRQVFASMTLPSPASFAQPSGQAQNPITRTPMAAGDPAVNRDALAREAIALALREDLGGPPFLDRTSAALIPTGIRARALLRLEQPGVVAGLEEAALVCQALDPTITIEPLVPEGTAIDTVPADVARLEGPAAAILAAERLALNLAQRLSAVATVTRACVEMAKPFGIAILDTRKTTPGLRTFEKRAVLVGGGQNHRFGLFDGMLIKDNHVRLAGGTRQAIERARAARPGDPIEVEVTTLDELREALALGVEAVLLDNMSPSQVAEAARAVAGRCYVEVSGGITPDTLAAYLAPGVDAVSLGALTHSAGHIDMSLDIVEFTS